MCTNLGKIETGDTLTSDTIFSLPSPPPIIDVSHFSFIRFFSYSCCLLFLPWISLAFPPPPSHSPLLSCIPPPLLRPPSSLASPSSLAFLPCIPLLPCIPPPPLHSPPPSNLLPFICTLLPPLYLPLASPCSFLSVLVSFLPVFPHLPLPYCSCFHIPLPPQLIASILMLCMQ